MEKAPVVVTAATGSGKSTEVPRWCPKPAVVVEPRRVACRALAARVAELEGGRLGDRVGYVVRDDTRAGGATELVFVTPGIALRALDRYLAYATFVLDEIHERTLDIDLLLALVRDRAQRLVLMSATIDARRLCESLGALHLSAEGRTFPVDLGYDESGPTVPTSDGLERRVAKAVRNLSSDAGDTLVFLPGRGEINRAQAALGRLSDVKLLELHGGMTPEAQTDVFQPSSHRKVILTTNVAETSVTVPGVRTVIDGGLVRQVRYVQGRGSLTLVPIARDSADQRAGRAGRTAPGRCFRLWRPHAHLDRSTAPEIHRLSLVPLVLASLAHGRRPQNLEWLDAPKSHALETAEEELMALGAIAKDGSLTDRGQALFRLPIDPWIGRVLIEAEAAGLLDDGIDLAAALSVGRSLYGGPPSEEDDPRNSGCDIIASIAAVRGGPGVSPGLRPEALTHRKRLRKLFGRPGAGPAQGVLPDRNALARAILKADARAARVARQRGRRTAWGGAGAEMELDNRSAVALRARDPVEGLPEAILVLGVHSLREGTKTRLIATGASPLRLAQLEELGLGTSRVAEVKWKRGRLTAEVERVYFGKVLGREAYVPEGDLLRRSVLTLIERNQLLKGSYRETEQRLTTIRLVRRLADAQLIKTYAGDLDGLPSEDNPHTFLQEKLETLGLEQAEDLELIEASDLLPPTLPQHLQEAVDRDYPQRVDLGEARYTVRYDLGSRRAVLLLESGGRRAAPPRNYLPRFPGLKVSIQAGGTTVDLG